MRPRLRRITHQVAGPLTGLLAAALLVLLFALPAAGAEDGGPGVEAATWEILDQRPADGQQCIVCRQAIHDGEIVELRYKGRTFFVAAKMLADFEADPDGYFVAMQAHGSLFDESALESPPMETDWLFFGIYGLLGIVCGAACAYLAVGRGLNGWAWFVAGLLTNVVALAVLLARKGATVDDLPGGLRKIPSTADPVACGHCGHPNHPSAARCSDCGGSLQPHVEPEVARL